MTGIRLFVFLSFLFELVFFLKAYDQADSKIWLQSFAFFELVAISIFFIGSTRGWTLALIGSCGLLFSCIITSVGNEEIHASIRIVNALMFIVFSILYFIRIVKENNWNDRSTSELLIVSGLLFYFSASLFTFLPDSLAIKLFVQLKTSWFFQAMSNTVKNVMIAVGIWMGRR